LAKTVVELVRPVANLARKKDDEAEADLARVRLGSAIRPCGLEAARTVEVGEAVGATGRLEHVRRL
jgi:hypothetical protein